MFTNFNRSLFAFKLVKFTIINLQKSIKINIIINKNNLINHYNINNLKQLISKLTNLLVINLIIYANLLAKLY